MNLKFSFKNFEQNIDRSTLIWLKLISINYYLLKLTYLACKANKVAKNIYKINLTKALINETKGYHYKKHTHKSSVKQIYLCLF